METADLEVGVQALRVTAVNYHRIWAVLVAAQPHPLKEAYYLPMKVVAELAVVVYLVDHLDANR